MVREFGLERARVVVWAANPGAAVEARARALADQLDLPVQSFMLTQGAPTGTLLLAVTGERLELRESTDKRTRPLCVDFSSGSLRHRQCTLCSARGDRDTSPRRDRVAIPGIARNAARAQPLARAMGLHKDTRLVIDATAGFLGDAFHLACLGCTVVCVERSPILAVLAADGITRASRSGRIDLVDVCQRLRLIHADSRAFLAGRDLPFRPDAILLDPMYAGGHRRALPGKELRVARSLVGDDDDARDLLDVALRVARRRVVVKRHPKAPPLGEPVTTQIHGRTVRYDVYGTTSSGVDRAEVARRASESPIAPKGR